VEPEEAEEALLDPQRISRDVYNIAGEHRRGAVGTSEAAASSLWCSRFGEHGCASSQRAMPLWSRSVGIVDGESDGVCQR